MQQGLLYFYRFQRRGVKLTFAKFTCKLRVLVTKSCPTLCDPWTITHQASLSMEFSRQEYWSGLPCPPPGDLPDPGIEPGSPALQADTLLFEPSGKHILALRRSCFILSVSSASEVSSSSNDN